MAASHPVESLRGDAHVDEHSELIPAIELFRDVRCRYELTEWHFAAIERWQKIYPDDGVPGRQRRPPLQSGGSMVSG